MQITGPLLLAFIIYHILHLTTGTVHPNFREGDVYHNLIHGLRVVPVAIIYVLAMAMLALHLWHGVYSMFGSLGLTHPKYTEGVKKFAAFVATVIALGNISFPIAVLTSCSDRCSRTCEQKMASHEPGATGSTLTMSP